MKTIYSAHSSLSGYVSGFEEKSLDLVDGRRFVVRLPITFGQRSSAAQLLVATDIGTEAVVFNWLDVVADMMKGVRVEFASGAALELLPDDIMQIDEAGWWLLMKRGVVPTGWVD